MAIVIHSEKEMEMVKAHGVQVEEGFTLAFNHDQQVKGVVNNKTQQFYVTLPLNGWRARNLAEAVLGERDASLWTLGKTMVVQTSQLKDLPGFDQKYYDMLNGLQFIGAVFGVMRVVHVDPGYGVHVTFHTSAKNTMFE